MDDLDLLRDGDGGDGTPPPKGRPWGLLAAALVAVLVAVSGLVWVVGSLTDGDTDVVPVGAASPSPTTAAPTTPPTPPTTPAAAPTIVDLPTTTAAAPSSTAGSAPPLPSVDPTTPRPTPTRATPTRRPTLPPLPKPTGVVIPDVTGLRVPAATLVLRSAGFKAAVPGGTVVPRPDQRRVRAQAPAAGSRAAAGSTVTLLLDSS